jgi:hypothetical protein
LGGRDKEDRDLRPASVSRPAQAKSTALSHGGIAQVVEHLPSKGEDLSSNHSTPKKEKKNTKCLNPTRILNLQKFFK